MEETEAYFIPHCDDGGCDLGVFQYTCPCCSKVVDNYDVWWKQNDIQAGDPEKFNCEKCKTPLFVEFNPDDWDYMVKKYLN